MKTIIYNKHIACFTLSNDELKAFSSKMRKVPLLKTVSKIVSIY